MDKNLAKIYWRFLFFWSWNKNKCKEIWVTMNAVGLQDMGCLNNLVSNAKPFKKKNKKKQKNSNAISIP